MNRLDPAELPTVRPRPELPSGLLTWLLARVRRDLVVALGLLVVAPAVAAVLLMKASQASKVYTSKIPLTALAYGEHKQKVEKIMEDTFAGIAGLAVADSSEFRRSHEWVRMPSEDASKQRFMSVLVTGDPQVAKQTHHSFLIDFASASKAMYPDVTFVIGDFSAEGAGIEMDDSPVVLPTRLALWIGLGLYSGGIALVMCSIYRARLGLS